MMSHNKHVTYKNKKKLLLIESNVEMNIIYDT